ncbi:MAG: hypothetical protein PsegKO_11070 [Pseudohongiellaceae bacterium]|jgi:hypothetical protein
MSDDSKTYHNITEQIFDCVKRESKKEHGTVYDPANGDSGTATTKVSFVGTIEMKFNLQNGDLTYTIVKKPGLVPESKIWDGICDTIKSCGGDCN